jgi:hypothetical protein
MDKLGLEVAGPLHTGVILGQLDLGEIVRDAASIWALPSQHHWQMSAPVPAVRLLEAKRHQGRLFPAPPDWRRAFAEVDVSVSARYSTVRDVAPGELAPAIRQRTPGEVSSARWPLVAKLGITW